METTPTDPNPNPNTTQTQATQSPIPPSSSISSSIPATPEFPPSSSSTSPMPTQNPQPQNPLQQQQQQQQQQPNFQHPQQRPPLGRPRPAQSAYHFTPHLPPSSSSSSSSSFSSAPPPSVSSATMQRGGVALGVPAHHTRPQQPAGSFSAFGSSPFNQPFSGLARNPANAQDQMGNSSAQGRQSIQGIQTIGMMGSPGPGSQMRPSGGVPGHHTPRPGHPPLRTQSPSLNNQSPLATQKLQGPGMLRVQSMGSSASPSQGAAQGSQQHTQPWMKGQMHASLAPSTYRSHMKSQTLQQRSHQPQQHQHPLPTTQNPQQMPSSQQQHQASQSYQQQEPHSQQYSLQRIQQPTPHQQQVTRAPASGSQKSNVPATMQPSMMQSGPVIPTGVNTDAEESGNQVISKRTVHELVSQIDPSEKLDPAVEDVLVEIAEDFIESITTFACSMAKHRKSTTLEARDILLHLERNWNMTLPGYGGDEIKSCKKPFVNDIHKERLSVIKRSVVGTDAGNTKTSAGQAAGNPKAHATKPPAAG